VGLADVSVDRSMVNGQGGSTGQQVPQVSLTPEADRWGPRSGWEKKKKKARFGSGPKGAGLAHSAQ
jgi:hypothetical protein